MANVSIKYKKKIRGIRFEVIKTNAALVIIVVDDEKRILKNKERVISRVCQELGLKKENLIEVNINTVEIIKDVGQTNYDI